MIYLLPEGNTPQNLQQALSGQFTISPELPEELRFGLYDTFDWRLIEKDLALTLTESEMRLINLNSGDIIQSLALNDQPNFVWNFPVGEIQRILEPILEMRALFNLGEVQKASIRYRLLNQDEKTVARLIYATIQPAGQVDHTDPLAYVELKGVRGYPRYKKDLENFCLAAGFLPSSPRDIYRRLIETGGKSPGDYSAKLNFHLTPEMRADMAARVILKFLLEVMRRNEAGIREDLDTEFLHDFRVAIRRTRSALKEIKGVFPASVTERFKGDFSRIGNFTNRLRDLDVYLLNESFYRAMLPEALQEYITPLFSHLRGRRSEALQEVIDGLDSPDYARILDDWELYLRSPLPDASASSAAGRPVLDLASHSIYKRYHSLVAGGKKIVDNVEDDRLHALRIECKKLRYLLEFFASLYPPEKMAILIKQLKVLQDNLGAFNDLSIQEVYLLKIAAELPVRDAAARQALVAIGSLVEALDERKKAVKGEFAVTFTHFATAENRRLFRTLFKGPRHDDPGVPS